jgi:uncharacterized membrane protein YraQ (UPF0718 family)
MTILDQRDGAKDTDMNMKRRKPNMLMPTIVMGVLAGGLLFLGYYKGQGQHIAGIKTAVNMTIQILPLLVFALLVAGMIQVLIPQDLIARWVGAESGWRGIMLGSLAGGLTPGGPFICFPLAAGIMKAGASMGTVVAFITGWAIWSLARIPMEVGILGWQFCLIRIASTLIFPPLAGMIAQMIYTAVK